MALELAHTVHPAQGPETAPPLLIAHGLFGAARNFHGLAQRLAQGRRVVAVDMRNHGASPWASDVSYPAMAADLARAIEDLCGGRAAVLGHSMGGKAAMGLALSRPGLLAGLIVADIAPVAYGHSHDGPLEAMRGLDLGAVGRRAEADAALAPTVPEAGLRAFLLQNLVFEGGRPPRWRINLEALGRGMASLTGWPEDWPAAPYAGPALFLRGGASDYVAAPTHSAVRTLFPAARIEAIEGAGHWLHAERPEPFERAVSGWLDR